MIDGKKWMGGWLANGVVQTQMRNLRVSSKNELSLFIRIREKEKTVNEKGRRWWREESVESTTSPRPPPPPPLHHEKVQNTLFSRAPVFA